MYKVVIVEDEFNAREVLRKMLNLLFNNLEIIGEFSSFSDAKAFLDSNTIDLAFFDIELEDGTSVEKLKTYTNLNFPIIFITSYSKYAIDAIKVNAIDYILKPIDPEELKTAMGKAIDKINKEKEVLALKEIEKQQEEVNKKIVIKTTDNTFYLDANEIIFLEAEGAYTTIFTTSRKILTSRNLRHYETLLEAYNFARPHQKYMVNINHVKSVDANHEIILTDGHRAKISTRKKSEILKKLNL